MAFISEFNIRICQYSEKMTAEEVEEEVKEEDGKIKRFLPSLLLGP